MNKIGSDCENIIFKFKHQMEYSEVMKFIESMSMIRDLDSQISQSDELYGFELVKKKIDLDTYIKNNRAIV